MSHINSTSKNQILYGWQEQAQLRGTFDILKSCGGTIILLCWSNVSPNVRGRFPHSRSSSWCMKFALFGLAILGPEFILVAAVGELNAAWKAKKESRALHAKENGCKEIFQEQGPWNLRQCFFANMGGVHLQFEGDTASFPVDCGQLLHLAQYQHIPLPHVPNEKIDALNKADFITRIIAVVQSVWFSIDVLVRLGQGLHVTTLELTTLSFAVLMTPCIFCWIHKPMDIGDPLVFKVDRSLQDVLDEITSAPPFQIPTDPQKDSRFGRTPLSFLNREEWFMSKFWSYYCQPLKHIIRPIFSLWDRIRRKKSGHEDQAAFPNHPDAHRFPAVYFREIDVWWEFSLVPLFIAYAAIFMWAWDFPFPTNIERDLWRASGTCNLIYGFVGSTLAALYQQSAHEDSTLFPYLNYCLNYCALKRDRQTRPVVQHHGLSRHQQEDIQMAPFQSDTSRDMTQGASTQAQSLRQRRWYDWMRNISPNQDPALDIPVPLWLTITFLCFAYAWSRAYILAEDLAGLRALPASTFQTVHWGQYSPIF